MEQPKAPKIALGRSTGFWVGIISGALTMPLFAYLIWFVTNGYGAWLFVVCPLVGGMVGGAIAASFDHREHHFLMAFCAYVLGAFITMCFLQEGGICLVIGSPILVPLSWLGFYWGGSIVSKVKDGKMPLSVSFVPLIIGYGIWSAFQEPEPAIMIQTTSMEIDATPEEVWPYLFNLTELDEPSFWLFKMGVAHPKSIHSNSQQVGDARECTLSTGSMHETITIADPYRHLKFEILATPPPMKEINPFGEVNVRHEHGVFEVHSGEFRLERLPSGGTRLTGSSEYSSRLYPVAYWVIWTDLIVDQVHRRVMGEIQIRAEAK